MPLAGVPDKTPVPARKLTPSGSAPVTKRVGDGEPLAVTVKVPADSTVNVVAFALLITGDGPAVGVTLFDDAEGGLVPTVLRATTVQLTAIPLVRPVTDIGDIAPLALLPAQVAM